MDTSPPMNNEIRELVPGFAEAWRSFDMNDAMKKFKELGGWEKRRAEAEKDWKIGKEKLVKLERDVVKLENKVKFVVAIRDSVLNVDYPSDATIIEVLKNQGFAPFPEEESEQFQGYNYLMHMPEGLVIQQPEGLHMIIYVWNAFHGSVIEEQNHGVNEEASKPHESAAQKRKQSNKEPNQCNKKPQQKKKLKHSTPRQKRTLEKELLEIPDDEIRFLPIRDLLRLVDYKEWLEKREAKGRKGSQTQESSSNAYENQYSQDDAYNLNSEEGRENQETSRVKPDSPVNYQTFLQKTARSRWSKQDTELFYEGIGEFGSNLSMVQQLFPGRSRQQLKLKYKLEERKHPLKLNDALTSRSKDHIHYQKVIKKRLLHGKKKLKLRVRMPKQRLMTFPILQLKLKLRNQMMRDPMVEMLMTMKPNVIIGLLIRVINRI